MALAAQGTLASASPAVTGDCKEQRDNCEGGVGAPGADAVPEPVALWERHSHCSAPRSSHAPPLAGKRGVSVTVLSPSPTLLHQNIPGTSDVPVPRVSCLVCHPQPG